MTGERVRMSPTSHLGEPDHGRTVAQPRRWDECMRVVRRAAGRVTEVVLRRPWGVPPVVLVALAIAGEFGPWCVTVALGVLVLLVLVVVGELVADSITSGRR